MLFQYRIMVFQINITAKTKYEQRIKIKKLDFKTHLYLSRLAR